MKWWKPVAGRCEGDGNWATRRLRHWASRQPGKVRSYRLTELLIEEIERDFECDVECREFLRAEAGDVIREGALG